MSVMFSIIVPTAGRATLARTLASFTSDLEPGDEVMVLRSDGEYGNEARDSAMGRAAGSHLLFMDDDDVYTENALPTIRQAVAVDPDRVHVFRMVNFDRNILWTDPDLRAANVGTPMVCIPNQPARLGRWSNPLGPISDFGFITRTMELRGDQPVFHEEVVAVVRP